WEADARTFIFNYVSPQSKKILGYESEEWIGKEGFWKSLIHPDDRDEAVEYCHIQTLKGINHTFEYRIKHKNGHYIWLKDIVTVISVDGSPRSLRGLMIDITEEKTLENKLKQAYNLSSVGTWELNLQTEELYWSDYLKALHEVDPDYTPELKSAINFYKKGENRDRIIKAVDKAIQENVSFDVELIIITAKGNERWIRTVGEPEFDQGKCIRLYGSTQDITQRKELELELTRAYKMAGIGNWEIDLINNTLYWSDVVKETFEVEPDFVPDVNSAIEFYTEGENRETITEAVEAAMEYGTRYDIELQITTDKGNKKWVRNIGEAEYRDGNCIRVFGTTQDVTGRKLAELKLLNVNASLTERIKEQTCLYQISNLNEQELKIHELLSEAVKMIPSGFLNPEITSSEIVFNGKSFATDGYENHSKKYRLSHEFKRSDNELKITVALEESTQYELRFLDEEDA
ncbi:MAG: PAS domain-containing protein, partial [Balneolaceae bacterium]